VSNETWSFGVATISPTPLRDSDAQPSSSLSPSHVKPNRSVQNRTVPGRSLVRSIGRSDRKVTLIVPLACPPWPFQLAVLASDRRLQPPSQPARIQPRFQSGPTFVDRASVCPASDGRSDSGAARPRTRIRGRCTHSSENLAEPGHHQTQ